MALMLDDTRTYHIAQQNQSLRRQQFEEIGWRGWLALRRAELDRAPGFSGPAPAAGTRIEIADLKERIRKLEAIAAGVEL